MLLGLSALPLLGKIFSSGKIIKALPDLLKIVMGGNIPDGVLKAINDKLDSQEGRSGGKMLGRACCEQIDNAVKAANADISIDDLEKVTLGLATNAAVQGAEALELYLAYPKLAANVERARRSGDATALATARQARNEATEKIKGAFIDIGRVVVGDPPLGTDRCRH